MKKYVRLCAVIFVTVMLFVCTMLNITAAEEELNVIDSVLINKDHTSLEIKGKLTEEYVNTHKGAKIQLLELLPNNSTSRLYEVTHIAEINVSASFTFKVPFDKESDGQIFAKYLVVSMNGNEYEIVTGARFIDNVDAVAEQTYAYPTYATKKGLDIQMIADAQELGVAHTVVDVAINELLLGESSNESETYMFNGIGYYINKTVLAQLDHNVRAYSEAGMQVFLNIKLTPPSENISPKIRCLYNDEASEFAKFFAINTQNPDSVKYLQAVLKFIAERYTKSDKEFGFAGSFIFGYEVNSNRTTNSMGARTLDSYLNSYMTAFRIADTALRSSYSNGRVYVSLANNFARRTKTDDVIADQQLDYAGRTFLESFNTKLRFSGNIPWHVAINIYASNRANAEIWRDESALEDFETHFITMKNIEVLCNFMSQDDFLYNGKTRSILISEFAVVSGMAEVYSSAQAASIGYSFYKAQTYQMIDAIIYRKHVDSSADQNKYGLWTSKEDPINSPATKKTSYNVFKFMDTAKSLESTQFALDLLGKSSWEEVIPGFKEANVIKRNLYDIIPVAHNDISGSNKKKILNEFETGDLSDFFVSDNAYGLELRTDPGSGITMLYGRLHSGYIGDYMGISVSADKPYNFKNVNYFSVRMKTEVPEGVEALSVMVRFYKNGTAVDGNAVYEGVTQILPNVWNDVTFKTSAITSEFSEIDVIKVWIKPYDQKEYPTEGFGIWIEDISTYGKGAFGIFTFLLWVILISVIGVVLFFVFIIIRNTLNVRKAKRRRAMQRERMMKERARQQGARPPQNRDNNNNNNNRR